MEEPCLTYHHAIKLNSNGEGRHRCSLTAFNHKQDSYPSENTAVPPFPMSAKKLSHVTDLHSDEWDNLLKYGEKIGNFLMSDFLSEQNSFIFTLCQCDRVTNESTHEDNDGAFLLHSVNLSLKSSGRF